MRARARADGPAWASGRGLFPAGPTRPSASVVVPTGRSKAHSHARAQAHKCTRRCERVCAQARASVRARLVSMRIQICAPACSRICAPLRVAVHKRMRARLGCTLRVARCALHAARFTLHVARCTIYVAQRVARCTFYAARCTLQLAAHLQADGLDELAHLPQPEPELGVELHLVLSAEDGRVQQHAAVQRTVSIGAGRTCRTARSGRPRRLRASRSRRVTVLALRAR